VITYLARRIGAAVVVVPGASFFRCQRSSATEVLAQDHTKVARATGLPEWMMLGRHRVRNACLPMVTLIGLSIPLLLAGNLITGSLFNVQGLGLLFLNGLNKEDYPVMLGYTLIGAILAVLGNLAAGIALTVADPRIRLA
jgi:peptide/nickel transport system permease protein